MPLRLLVDIYLKPADSYQGGVAPLRLGINRMMQINWEVLAGMNAEWVGEWVREKAAITAERCRWGPTTTTNVSRTTTPAIEHRQKAEPLPRA